MGEVLERIFRMKKSKLILFSLIVLVILSALNSALVLAQEPGEEPTSWIPTGTEAIGCSIAIGGGAWAGAAAGTAGWLGGPIVGLGAQGTGALIGAGAGLTACATEIIATRIAKRRPPQLPIFDSRSLPEVRQRAVEATKSSLALVRGKLYYEREPIVAPARPVPGEARWVPPKRFADCGDAEELYFKINQQYQATQQRDILRIGCWEVKKAGEAPTKIAPLLGQITEGETPAGKPFTKKPSFENAARVMFGTPRTEADTAAQQEAAKTAAKQQATVSTNPLGRAANEARRVLRALGGESETVGRVAVPESRYVPGETFTSSLSNSELAGGIRGAENVGKVSGLGAGVNTDPSIEVDLPEEEGKRAEEAAKAGGGGTGGAKAAGYEASAEVKDPAEKKCVAGEICVVYPKQGSTVARAELKADGNVELQITTFERTLCKYDARNADFNYDTAGEFFSSDAARIPGTNHTQTVSGQNDGLYRIHYKCKVSQVGTAGVGAAKVGEIMNITHTFRIGKKDLTAGVQNVTIEDGKVKVKLNVTADEAARTGNKTIEVTLKKDDKTVKVLNLDAEIEPLEQPADGVNGTLWFLIGLLVVLFGVLFYLLLRYKKSKSPGGRVVSGYRPLEEANSGKSRIDLLMSI